jgi:hypothetical protein
VTTRKGDIISAGWRDKTGRFSSRVSVRVCRVEGCDADLGRKQMGGGLCNKHYLRLRRTGTTDDPRPRCTVVAACRVDGCNAETHKRKLCRQHYLEQEATRRKDCSVAGCGRDARMRGMCGMHYSRWKRSGVVGNAAPKQRGPIADPRSSHPLYMYWRMFLVRSMEGARYVVCDRWKKDFWNFVADMGTRPTRGHTLIRIDRAGEYSPDNCMWATAAQRNSTYVKVVPLSALQNEIIKPGVERKLVPLALYRGTRSMGHIQRWWNFSIAMMKSECRDFSEGVFLSHNPEYSQLLGPERKVEYRGIHSFFSRLALNPKVTDNISGLSEYVRELCPNPFQLSPVDLYSANKSCAPWRIYRPKIQAPGNIKDTDVKTKDRMYPYVVHEPENPINRLTILVNSVVPRGIPLEFRADICQDLIVDLLAGDLAEDQLIGSPRKYVGQKMRQYKVHGYNEVSLETELIDVLQHDEARDQFDKFVENEIDTIGEDDDFKAYAKQALGQKFKVTSQKRAA